MLTLRPNLPTVFAMGMIRRKGFLQLLVPEVVMGWSLSCSLMATCAIAIDDDEAGARLRGAYLRTY